ncbi:DUF3726 domain-containing protein [Rhodobacterales bacterium HKCCSP123]|nr:DUF3726 domain-containing protein [Rhodobacterales bacterium HKCCSP123]
MSVVLSLGELEATARKAARGAGYAWGVADEAGRAARAMAEIGLDGARLLRELADAVAARPHHSLVPARLDSIWAATEGPLCPIRAGAALCDLARSLPEGGMAVSRVLVPGLFLPFAADAARVRDAPVTLSWRGGIVGIGPEGLPRASGVLKLAEAAEADLFLHPGGTALPAAPHETRARPDPAAWDVLLSLAHRTYAPATEASRLSGAGAGLSDND